MPSLRTLPDRPVSVNPHFAPFSPMWPAQNASAVAGVRTPRIRNSGLDPEPGEPGRIRPIAGCRPGPPVHARGGSSLGTVLERAAPAPPDRARRPGGRAGGDPVHHRAGRRHRAGLLGHRVRGRPRAGLGGLRRGEGLEAFQCATAVVPLDYDRPKGKQITLALARLPASDPSRRIGSLFLNPGGPGGSGRRLRPRRRPVPLLRRGQGPLRPGRLRPPRHHRAAPRCAATTPSTRPWPTWPRSRSR